MSVDTNNCRPGLTSHFGHLSLAADKFGTSSNCCKLHKVNRHPVWNVLRLTSKKQKQLQRETCACEIRKAQAIPRSEIYPTSGVHERPQSGAIAHLPTAGNGFGHFRCDSRAVAKSVRVGSAAARELVVLALLVHASWSGMSIEGANLRRIMLQQLTPRRQKVQEAAG